MSGLGGGFAAHAWGSPTTALEVERVPTVHTTDARVAECEVEAGPLDGALGAEHGSFGDGDADGWVGGPPFGVGFVSSDSVAAQAFGYKNVWCHRGANHPATPASTHNLRLPTVNIVDEHIDGEKESRC